MKVELKTKDGIINFISKVIGGIAYLFLIAYPVMWIWNTSIAEIFDVGLISYSQALSIYLLCNILLKKNQVTNI